MRPIVNMPEEDRATDMGNMHQKIGKDCALDVRQTDRQTDILITILLKRSRRRSKYYKLKQKTHKMLNINKHAITKPKPKPTFNFKNCSHVCTYHCVQLSYTTQHKTVLIVFPPILQTIIIAQMMSLEGNGGMQTTAATDSTTLHSIIMNEYD